MFGIFSTIAIFLTKNFLTNLWKKQIQKEFNQNKKRE